MLKRVRGAAHSLLRLVVKLLFNHPDDGSGAAHRNLQINIFCTYYLSDQTLTGLRETVRLVWLVVERKPCCLLLFTLHIVTMEHCVGVAAVAGCLVGSFGIPTRGTSVGIGTVAWAQQRVGCYVDVPDICHDGCRPREEKKEISLPRCIAKFMRLPIIVFHSCCS